MFCRNIKISLTFWMNLLPEMILQHAMVICKISVDIFHYAIWRKVIFINVTTNNIFRKVLSIGKLSEFWYRDKFSKLLIFDGKLTFYQWQQKLSFLFLKVIDTILISKKMSASNVIFQSDFEGKMALHEKRE